MRKPVRHGQTDVTTAADQGEIHGTTLDCPLRTAGKMAVRGQTNGRKTAHPSRKGARMQAGPVQTNGKTRVHPSLTDEKIRGDRAGTSARDFACHGRVQPRAWMWAETWLVRSQNWRKMRARHGVHRGPPDAQDGEGASGNLLTGRAHGRHTTDWDQIACTFPAALPCAQQRAEDVAGDESSAVDRVARDGQHRQSPAPHYAS